MTTANRWSYGTELECYVRRDSVARYWTIGGYHRGIQIPGAPDGWRAESDASIHGSSGHVPVEIVSPKLSGLGGLEDLSGVILALRDDLDGGVNQSCGAHVHIDARPFMADRSKVAALVNGFCRYEDDLYRLNGPRYSERIHNAYCARVNRDRPYFNRMQALNLTNIESGGGRIQTVEWRLWAGSLDPDYAIVQVAVSLALTRHYTMGGTDPEPGIDGICRMILEHPICEYADDIAAQARTIYSSTLAGVT